MKYMNPVASNQQRTPMTGLSVFLSSSATKAAIGSCDVLSRRDPPSTAVARPTTALPRYMQDTAVSRQRTFFLSRHGPTSRQPPKSALPTDSNNVTQAKVDIRRRSLIVVEGDSTATKEAGLAGGDPTLQGPTETEPLEKTGLSLRREVSGDGAEGPAIEKEGFVIEEVTVPLDLSSSVGQSAGIDQRPYLGRFINGVILSPTYATQFVQHSDSVPVRLPDISSSGPSSLRRTSSEFPLIGALHFQRDREWKQEPEVESRSTSSSAIECDDPDSCPLAMGDHRRSSGGPETSSGGGDGPLKRSMPSTTTLSSGSGHNVPGDSRRPSKIQLTDGVTTNGLVGTGGSTTTTTATTRQYDDDVFLRPMPAKHPSTRREDRYPPSTVDTPRVSMNRRTSMPLPRNGDCSAKDQLLSPRPRGLSEDALRTLDEINLANDITRIQNNLERFQRTSRTTKPPMARPSLQQAQQPAREKKNSWAADAVGRQRRTPAVTAAAALASAAGGKGLLRTSKSQPNLIRHQRLQQHQPQQQQQFGVRNPVTGSRNARKGQPFKSEDLEDEDDDYDEEDERTQRLKRERIVRWLIGANECAEPPPGPTIIEDDRPPQTDNAIHIVYKGDL